MLNDNVASIALVAETGRLAQGLRAAGNMVEGWAKSTRGVLTSMALAPGKALGNIGKAIGTLATFGVAARGLDVMVELGQSVFDFERKLTRFGIATRQGATKMDELRRAARATSVATGVDAVTVLDSARAYVDLAGAQQFSIEKMNILARAGQASEAAGKDLAGMMYQLTRSMKITDEQMEDTMGGLINQAKDGAIEAKQMAAEFAGMMPIFARFGVIGREGAIRLGAMYQVTRDGFDSAAQAQTGMIRLMAGFQRHASRFREWGVQVFKKGSKKDLRDLSDIMEQVKKSPLSKNIEGLIKAFGRSEAWRTFELLAEAPQRLKELEEAGRQNGVIAKDIATFTESASGRMDVAFEKMKNGFAEVLTPERVDQIVSGIQSIANAMPTLMHAIGSVVSLFGKFVHQVQKAKNYLQGDSKLELTDDEKSLVRRMEAQEKDKLKRLSPEQMAAARKIRARKQDYDAAIGDIMDKEDDFGPTDASIKRAIEYGRSWHGSGPKMPGDSAAISYLKGREKDITTARYKRLEAEVQAEDKARMSVFGFDPQEKFRQGQEAAQQQQFIKNLAEAIGTVINGKPTRVEIDGNPVAKSSGNATDRRRR